MAKKLSKQKALNPFQDRWRIIWMEQWDQDFVDEEVEEFFEFDTTNRGSFQFGLIRCDIDYRIGTREGKPAVEFSFEGTDEMDAVMGRGWAVLDGDKIEGAIFFHQGDESEFRATRTKPARDLKRKRR
jgi:hypothetical protein